MPSEVDGSPPTSTRAIKGFAWAVASLGGSRVVVFISTLVLARILVPREFGIVSAGLAYIAYLEVVLDLGVSSAVVFEQEVGITRRVRTAFTVNLVACVIFTGIGVAGSSFGARFFHIPHEVAIFRALSCYLAIGGFGQVGGALLRRDLRFAAKTVVDLTKALVRAGLSIGLALAGYGAWAIVLGLLAGELCGAVLATTLARFRPRPAFDRGAASGMLRFGVGVLALAILGEAGLNADYLVVGNRLGSIALGVYTMAYRLPELLISNLFWVFSSVAFPAYSRTNTVGGTDALRSAMLKSLRYVTLYGFTVGAGLAIASRDIVGVLLSTRWANATVPMALVALGAAFGSVGYASGDLYTATGQPRRLLKINGPVVTLKIIGFVIAAPHGLVAVAAVHVVGNFAYAFVRLEAANRIVGSTWRQDLDALRPGLIAAAGVVVCALPVRLLGAPGAMTLLLTVVMGIAGASLALRLLDPPVLGDLRGVLAKAYR